MTKVGFLLPRSTVYPLIGVDLLGAFSLFIKEILSEHKIEICSDNIGFGLDEAEVYSKNEKILLEQNADIVFAFVDGRVAEMLEPLYNAVGKILVLVNMGTHYPAKLNSPSNIMHLSYNIGFHSYLTGKLAAADKNTKAIFSTSYYDGGYLHCHAMVNAFLQQGGNIMYNFISHFKAAEFSIDPLTAAIGEHDTPTLLSVYSGDIAPSFYNAISALQQKKEIVLYASPMMLDTQLKKNLAEDLTIKNVQGYTAWSPDIKLEENKNFVQLIESSLARETSMFHLLGWEAGLLLKTILPLLPAKSNHVITALENAHLNSPRGILHFDKDYNEIFTTPWLVNISDQFRCSVSAYESDSAQERTNYIATKPTDAASGWRNTYLCS
jgi:branched-chain amino acid transport system substrate-binding protein